MRFARYCFVFLLAFASATICHAQKEISKVWVADNGDGTYKNPILHADYSDPDAIRVGDDYYMTASSFDQVPGLPILHSKDLVNWSLTGYALKKQPPFDVFDKPQHGNGVWAPAIRYHNNEFLIYYPDPDFGIYLVRAKNSNGPWNDPVLVEAGKGLIDPCPFWDDDGKVYLAHAYAGSRAGIKSIIVIKEMNAAGTHTIGEPVLVFDGHTGHPTVEGSKLYKRNGYYYIFAPAGGVATGWQLVLRSKNIYGPYETKIVMDQGKTPVNGPHQGAWVTTQKGEDWFLHFQDKDVYGRVVHLQPMQWINDWPVIGDDKDGDGKGEPVLQYRKPGVGKKNYPVSTPPESDEFNEAQPGLQWQWAANYNQQWGMHSGRLGYWRMYAYKNPSPAKNLWDIPNRFTQKMPAENFTATLKLSFHPKFEEDRVGLLIMGQSYAYVGLKQTKTGTYITYTSCSKANKGNAEQEQLVEKINTPDCWLRVTVKTGGLCSFAYSIDGNAFKPIAATFQAEPGQWIGARVGLFCTSETKTTDAGYADMDWFRISP